MTDPHAHWPPIITSAARPRAILWRDIILTLMMWAVLLLILYTELDLIWNGFHVLRGKPGIEIDPQLAQFWRRLRPLLWLMAALVAMLAIATVISRDRRNRAILQSPPPPLAESAIAVRAGISEAELAAGREHRIAVVHVDDDGRLRIEQRPNPVP